MSVDSALCGPSLPSRLLAAADRLASTFHLFEGPFTGEALMRLAERRIGLDDFGERSFEAPLDILLRDIESSASLSLFGRLALRWDVQRFLGNLLLLREREKRRPEILKEPIERPIFITGMPRSGSTFLHNLIARDPMIQVPRSWQTMYPCPRPGRTSGWPGREIAAAGRQLAGFNRLAPELAAIHPMDAQSGQECTEILAHGFRSSRFETVYRLEAYPRWLRAHGELPAYAFHKRFLQHLQHGRMPGRWILKCPDHVFCLAALRRVYPDAGMVFLHRDPLKVLPSVARLTEVLRRPFARRIDRPQIGRQVSESWSRGAALMIEEWARKPAAGPPVLHVAYRDLIADPIATVRLLYTHFAMPLGEEALAAFANHLAGRKNGGYRKLAYDPCAYGLDLGAEARRFAPYCERFGIAAETAP